jgi:F-type H+-transporting ATPase subunit a
MAEHAAHSPLDHVVDHNFLEVPGFGWPIPLPNIGFQITRFMVMEVIAACLIAAVVIPLARHVKANKVSRGYFMNMFETLVMFVRDGIARPAIGGHGADDFLPYLWTIFFFVLFNNLLGMIPGGSSPTGNINVTAVLALSVLFTVIYAGIRQSGPIKYWTSLVPHLDVPILLKVFLWPLMFVIEVAGILIKHVVLAVRLFANMMAGHIVLAVILGFILVAGQYLIWVIAPVSVAGVVALSLLELFVAFLQSYIFTFLAALFIGMAVHPH